MIECVLCHCCGARFELYCSYLRRKRLTMLNSEETSKIINERIPKLKDSEEKCALFLIATGTAVTGAAPDEHILGLLARSFRSYDIIGYMGSGLFAVFISGMLTDKVIWEKAETLSRSLRLEASKHGDPEEPCCVGVYMFDHSEDPFEQILLKSMSALETAKKEHDHFYIYKEDESGLRRVTVTSGEIVSTSRVSSPEDTEEWLSFLAARTDYQFWDLDLSTGVFHLLFTDHLLSGREVTYTDFPDSLINSGRIHKDSAERFIKFAEGMYRGRSEDSANFMIQYRQSSCYSWANMSYRTLYDKDGKPARIIGVKRDLSYIPEEQRSFRRRTMPPQLYPHLFGYLQADLSADKCERLQIEGLDQSYLARYSSFSDIIAQGLERLFSSDDTERFIKRFDREKLMEDYRSGRQWIFERCRIIDKNGSIRWIAIGVNLVRDLETMDICLFAYLLSEDQRKEWEHDINIEAKTDPLTGLYTEKTGRAMIDRLFSRGLHSTYVLSCISLEGSDELFTDKIGKMHHEDLLAALNIFLDTDCIPMLSENGSILVFFPNAISRTYIQRRIENAFFYARISLEEMPELRLIRFIAGSVAKSSGTADLDSMIAAASGICALHTDEPSDSVIFSDANERYIWTAAELSDEGYGTQASSIPPANIMSDAEKNAALSCMELMLSSESLDDSTDGVLRCLGNFYQADRVYILTLTENDRIVTMLNEWVGKNKFSIRHSVSGKSVDRFPVIHRYLKGGSPVFLTMRRNPDMLPDDGTEKKPWQFAIYPMKDLKGAKRLLCIDNPKLTIAHSALLDEVVPYLSNERKRFLSKNELTISDHFASLKDINSYQEIIDSFDSVSYSSMGVLAIDIPEFSTIRENRGFRYGNTLLSEFSDILTDVFGDKHLFHTTESEFVVLSVNITYEVFINSCALTRQLIGRKYSKLFRIGYTWAEKAFNGRDLVKKALSIMECAQTSDSLSSNENAAAAIKEDSLGHPFGHFTIYLQPKIDMRTGKMIGAEALCRIMDEHGNLMPHVRIIESMERDRSIQNLDYFVLDRTLSTISSWQKKGYPTIPISHNFSRYTLLNPSSLASVLAIMSRYPDVAEDLTEIEITETAGAFENNTFSELMERFGNYGLRFSLDDFGASYSNLSMLANLNFHSVKLDRSMIQHITDNPVSLSMARDIANICQQCGTICIAEGVETKAQADTLLENGCFYAQGFYYGRPMSIEDFENKYFSTYKKDNKEEVL